MQVIKATFYIDDSKMRTHVVLENRIGSGTETDGKATVVFATNQWQNIIRNMTIWEAMATVGRYLEAESHTEAKCEHAGNPNCELTLLDIRGHISVSRDPRD